MVRIWFRSDRRAQPGGRAPAAARGVHRPCAFSSRTSCLKLARAWGNPLICCQKIGIAEHIFSIVTGMELKAIRVEVPENGNIIIGQSHFIKTVEDVYEAIVNTVPQMKFGVAFNEASGPCLTRVDGNDEELKALAARDATAIGAGHIFVVAMREGYPDQYPERDSAGARRW